MDKNFVMIRFLNSGRIDVVEAWKADIYEKYGVAIRAGSY